MKSRLKKSQNYRAAIISGQKIQQSWSPSQLPIIARTFDTSTEYYKLSTENNLTFSNKQNDSKMGGERKKVEEASLQNKADQWKN